MTQKKISTKYSCLQKIFNFLKTPKIIEIQNFEPQKIGRAYVCVKISEYPPPPGAKTQLTMLFKIIHGLVDIPAEDYLVPASTRTRSQHSLKFLQIPVSSDYYKFSFFPRTFCRWNSVPANVAEAPSLVTFGSYLVCQFKLSGPAMQVHSCDTLKLCCRGLRVPWYSQGR